MVSTSCCIRASSGAVSNAVSQGAAGNFKCCVGKSEDAGNPTPRNRSYVEGLLYARSSYRNTDTVEVRND